MHRLADQNLVDIMKYQEIRVSLINLDSVKQFIYARTAIEERVIRDFMAKDEALLIEDVDHLIRKQSIVFEQEKFKRCGLLSTALLTIPGSVCLISRRRKITNL